MNAAKQDEMVDILFLLKKFSIIICTDLRHRRPKKGKNLHIIERFIFNSISMSDHWMDIKIGFKSICSNTTSIIIIHHNDMLKKKGARKVTKYVILKSMKNYLVWREREIVNKWTSDLIAFKFHFISVETLFFSVVFFYHMKS